MDLPERQETFVLGCTRRGDSFPVCPQKAEYCLNELQRWTQAMAINLNPRDGHKLLILWPLPQRILCASTGHYPHPTLGACAAHHCQGPEMQGQVPRENTLHSSGCCNVVPASATAGSPAFQLWLLYSSISPSWEIKRALISRCLNPLLSGRVQTPEGGPQAEAGSKPKLNTRRCVNEEEKGKFLCAASGSAD